jgi:hypothetical protein
MYIIFIILFYFYLKPENSQLKNLSKKRMNWFTHQKFFNVKSAFQMHAITTWVNVIAAQKLVIYPSTLKIPKSHQSFPPPQKKKR